LPHCHRSIDAPQNKDIAIAVAIVIVIDIAVAVTIVIVIIIAIATASNRCPTITDTMSSNPNKRSSTSPTAPLQEIQTASSSSGRPSISPIFVAVEDAALCKAYVNVTFNPIDGVGQKSSSFWDHIHRKNCVLLKEDNPSSNDRSSSPL
jgi:hypothetical protein